MVRIYFKHFLCALIPISIAWSPVIGYGREKNFDPIQLLYQGVQKYQKTGVRALDAEKFEALHRDYPVLIGVYHLLSQESTRLMLKETKVYTGPHQSIVFQRSHKEKIVFSDFAEDKLAFKVNGIEFDFTKIKTFSDLQRKVERDLSKKKSSASLLDWLIPRAEADLGLTLGFIGTVLGIISFVRPLVNSWLGRMSKGDCVKKVAERFENDIAISKEVKIFCLEQGRKKDRTPQPKEAADPQKTEKVIVLEQSKEPKAEKNMTETEKMAAKSSTVMTPKMTALAYINEVGFFPGLNFEEDYGACERVMIGINQDLTKQFPANKARADWLKEAIDLLPKSADKKQKYTEEEYNCFKSTAQKKAEDIKQKTAEAKREVKQEGKEAR